MTTTTTTTTTQKKGCKDYLKKILDYDKQKVRAQIMTSNTFKTEKERENALKIAEKQLKKFNTKFLKVAYCDKTRKCKGTIFEAGDDEKIVDKLLLNKDITKIIEKAPKYKVFMKKLFMQQRKNIFNGKKDVVDKDGFYNGLSKQDKEEMKEDGAESGCTLLNIFNKKQMEKFEKLLNERIESRKKRNKSIKKK